VASCRTLRSENSYAIEILLDPAEEIHAIHEVRQPVEPVSLKPEYRREIVALEPVLVEAGSTG
jgi:hypothetical protein